MEKLNNKYTIVSSILIATEKNPEVLQEIEAALAAFALKAVDQEIFTD